jgi:hypothetical protein
LHQFGPALTALFGSWQRQYSIEEFLYVGREFGCLTHTKRIPLDFKGELSGIAQLHKYMCISGAVRKGEAIFRFPSIASPARESKTPLTGVISPGC